MGKSCYFAFLREGVTSEQDLKGENHAKVQEKHVQSSKPSLRLMCLAVYSRYSKLGCISGVLEILVHTLKSQHCSPLPKSMFSHAYSLKSAMEEEFKSCKSTNMTNESFSPSILPLFPCTEAGESSSGEIISGGRSDFYETGSHGGDLAKMLCLFSYVALQSPPTSAPEVERVSLVVTAPCNWQVVSMKIPFVPPLHLGALMCHSYFLKMFSL